MLRWDLIVRVIGSFVVDTLARDARARETLAREALTLEACDLALESFEALANSPDAMAREAPALHAITAETRHSSGIAEHAPWRHCCGEALPE